KGRILEDPEPGLMASWRLIERRWVLLALLALATGAACQGPPPAAQAGDRLGVARSSDAVSLDPARANDIESLEVAEQVYGRLVRFAPGRLEPEADLATSWSVSPDGTVWT